MTLGGQELTAAFRVGPTVHVPLEEIEEAVAEEKANPARPEVGTGDQCELVLGLQQSPDEWPADCALPYGWRDRLGWDRLSMEFMAGAPLPALLLLVCQFHLQADLLEQVRPSLGLSHLRRAGRVCTRWRNQYVHL